jgi:hypothetical protein
MSNARLADRIAVALQIAGVVLVGVAISLRRVGDFDLPWHMAYGRAIVATRSIPRIDDFAFTHRPIQYAEFLADLLLYGVQRVGGPLGLQVLGGLCGVTIALLMLAASRPYQATAPIVVAASLAAMNAWLIVRPATLSFVLVALFVFLLDAHRERGSRRALAALAVLQILWANVHGFVVLGMGLLALYAAYRSAARVFDKRFPTLFPGRDGHDAWFAVAAAGAGLVLSLINLGGPRLLLGPLRTSGDFDLVTEWATTTPRFILWTEPGVGIVLALFLLAVLLGREPRTGRRCPPALDIALGAAAIALGASAVRLLPVSAILVCPFVARRLSAVVPPTGWVRVAGSLSIVLAAGFMALRPGTELGVGFDMQHYPEGAVGYIRSARPQGRMWNFMPFGGWLVWRLYPDYRVMVDGRSAWVHDPALWKRALESDRRRDAFESIARDLDLQFAVSRASEGELFGEGVASAPGWQMVYWDDCSAVYVKRGGPNEALAVDGYRLLRHLTPPGQVLVWAMTRPDLSVDLARDTALAAAQAPDSPRAAFLDGCGAIATRDAERLRRARDRLEALAPGHPAIRILAEAWTGSDRPSR